MGDELAFVIEILRVYVMKPRFRFYQNKQFSQKKRKTLNTK